MRYHRDSVGLHRFVCERRDLGRLSYPRSQPQTRWVNAPVRGLARMRNHCWRNTTCGTFWRRTSSDSSVHTRPCIDLDPALPLHVLHVTSFRWWRSTSFEAPYVPKQTMTRVRKYVKDRKKPPAKKITEGNWSGRGTWRWESPARRLSQSRTRRPRAEETKWRRKDLGRSKSKAQEEVGGGKEEASWTGGREEATRGGPAIRLGSWWRRWLDEDSLSYAPTGPLDTGTQIKEAARRKALRDRSEKPMEIVPYRGTSGHGTRNLKGPILKDSISII